MKMFAKQNFALFKIFHFSFGIIGISIYKCLESHVIFCTVFSNFLFKLEKKISKIYLILSTTYTFLMGSQ